MPENEPKISFGYFLRPFKRSALHTICLKRECLFCRIVLSRRPHRLDPGDPNLAWGMHWTRNRRVVLLEIVFGGPGPAGPGFLRMEGRWGLVIKT